MPEENRLLKKYFIKVYKADHPDNIYWENVFFIFKLSISKN
jgi:hypothetical protein